MAKSKTLDFSEVAFYEPWSKSCWKSVEGAETWRRQPSNVKELEQFANFGSRGIACRPLVMCWSPDLNSLKNMQQDLVIIRKV